MTAIRRILAAGALALLCLPAGAQDSAWWVGAELGDPAAITLLRERPSGPDIELTASYDLNDFIFLTGHLLYAGDEQLTSKLTWFYGPGVFVGARDDEGTDKTAIGASGRAGVQLGLGQFALYVHLTPRFEIIPSTDFGLGGGLGLRFRL